jgi:hypothetical protein
MRYEITLKKGKKSPVIVRRVDAASREEAVRNIRKAVEDEGLLWYAITEVKELP